MGNPEKRNRNLYCQYHRDHGYTTEDCRSLWDHLDQLVREGKLKQLLHHSSVWVVRPMLGRKERIFHDPLSELSTLYLWRLAERGHGLQE